MTEKMRKEVARIRALKSELEAKRQAISKIPIDEISEEEEDRLFDMYTDQIGKAITAEYDAQVSAFRPNGWFRNFIVAFGECESKRVTKKQAEIFARYLPFESQINSFSSFHGTSFVVGSKYKGKYLGKIYESSLYSDCGYLTVRAEVTI
jgi:hypothetical protein